MADLECRGVILCDEIRQEKSEKYILLGVYSAGVVTQQMPAKIKLALFLSLVFPKSGSTDLFLEVKFGKGQARLHVELEISDITLPVGVPIPPIPLTFDEPGDMIVAAGLSEESLREIARFPVQLNPEIWTLYPTGGTPPPEQSQNAAPDSASPPAPSRRPDRKKK